PRPARGGGVPGPSRPSPRSRPRRRSGASPRAKASGRARPRQRRLRSRLVLGLGGVLVTRVTPRALAVPETDARRHLDALAVEQSAQDLDRIERRDHLAELAGQAVEELG